MTKILWMIIKIMTGFIFIVAFVEAVKLAVAGIKKLISLMVKGRKKLEESIKKDKEEWRLKRQERKAEKIRRKNGNVIENINNEEEIEAQGA